MTRWLTLLIGLSITPAAMGERERLAGAVFEGVTPYTTEALLSSYRDNLGAVLDEVVRQRIAHSIVRLYTSDGYLEPTVVTAVHPRSGILAVAVREPVVAQVSVAGEEHIVDPRFWEEVELLKSERPLREASFQTWLKQLNGVVRTPVTGSIVRAGRGRHEHVARLQVAPSRWSGYVHVDNRAPEVLGYELFQSQLAYRFADPRAGTVSFSGAVALDQDRLRFVAANGSHELRPAGTAAVWGLSRSESRLPNVDDTRHDYDRMRATLGVQQSLYRMARLRVDGFANLTRYDVDQHDQTGTLVRDDRVRSADVGVTWSGVSSASRRHDLTARVTRGLDVMGARLTATPGRDTALDYLRTDLSYRLVQQFGEAWLLQFTAQAQLTSDELPTSEQFLIGGRQLGGAFDPASVAGDEGFGGRLEGARTLPATRFLERLQAYGYYDYGFSDSNSEAGKSDEGSSVGAGVRFGRVRLAGSLEVAVPIEKPRTNPLADSGTRVFFTLTSRFP